MVPAVERLRPRNPYLRKREAGATVDVGGGARMTPYAVGKAEACIILDFPWPPPGGFAEECPPDFGLRTWCAEPSASAFWDLDGWGHGGDPQLAEIQYRGLQVKGSEGFELTFRRARGRKLPRLEFVQDWVEIRYPVFCTMLAEIHRKLNEARASARSAERRVQIDRIRARAVVMVVTRARGTAWEELGEAARIQAILDEVDERVLRAVKAREESLTDAEWAGLSGHLLPFTGVEAIRREVETALADLDEGTLPHRNLAPSNLRS